MLSREDRIIILIYIIEALVLGFILQNFWTWFWNLTSEPIQPGPNFIVIVIVTIFTAYFIYQEIRQGDYQLKHLAAFAVGFIVIWSVVDIFTKAFSVTYPI